VVHVASQLVRQSPTEASWLSMVDIGVSLLVTSGAVALFLKTRAMQPDGQPLLSGDGDTRWQSLWRGIGGLILCLVGTLLIIVLVRLLGYDSAQVSRPLDITTAVAYPFFGLIVLMGLIRKGSAQRADMATSRR
jgi:hypothetical protein